MIIGVLLEAAAAACSFVSPAELVIVPSEDTVAPSVPALGLPSVVRGRGPRGFLNQSVTSCDSSGWIELTASSDDDEALPEELAFDVDLVEGDLPEGLVLPEGPMTYFPPETLLWVWIDEATDEQEPFSFVVAVRAVDQAGNTGEAAEVTLADPGSSKGCATTTAGGLLAALLAAASVRLNRR